MSQIEIFTGEPGWTDRAVFFLASRAEPDRDFLLASRAELDRAMFFGEPGRAGSRFLISEPSRVDKISARAHHWSELLKLEICFYLQPFLQTV